MEGRRRDGKGGAVSEFLFKQQKGREAAPFIWTG
jgi:hypothetical protein